MNDQERIEWLKARRIGGSDAGTIIGVNPFKTRLQLWEEKVKLLDGVIEEQELTPPMMRGIVLEPVAADLYAEKTGRKIRHQPLRQHPDYEFMTSSIDRQILAVGDVESTGALELKCPGLQVMSKVKAHGLLDYMTTQLMHNCAVYDYDWGSFGLFNAERWDLIWFDLEADQEFIGMLIEKEDEFWNKYVVPRLAPPEEDVDLAFEIPEVEGELTIVDGAEWREAALELQEARTLKGAAAELEEIAAEKLKARMQVENLDAIEIDGQARIYWRLSEGRPAWKQTAEAIAVEAGLDLDAFKVVGKGSRTFRPYFLSQQEE